MAKTRYFFDTESQELYTLEQLEKMYDEFKKNGDTDEECFSHWLGNCTSKNGVLDEVTYRRLDTYAQNRKSTLPIVAYDYYSKKMLDCICLEDFADYIVAEINPWGEICDIYGNQISEAVYVVKNQ